MGVNVPLADPAYAEPLNGPTVFNRFAPLNCNAVFDVPPHERPVTVPLPPEFVPPSDNCSDCGPTKSVSET